MRWRDRAVPLLLAALVQGATAAGCHGTVTCGNVLDSSSLVQHSVRSSLGAELQQQEDASLDAGQFCPDGYRRAVGDVPGWDQFGRDMGNSKHTIALCAADCSGRPSCASFEWSARTKICSLNKVANPTLGRFEDYVFCQRKHDSVDIPHAPAVAEVAGSQVACPDGYEHVDGDVPGYDQFSRGSNNKKDTVELCAADCNERRECLSLEWSPTTKTCSLNKVASPSAPRFQDYAFCRRRQEASPPASIPQLAATQEGAAKQALQEKGMSEEEEAAEKVRKRRGCPEGYEFVNGDVPGGDQFGRDKHSKRDSVDLCAAECNRRDSCKSLEWSPSRKTCNLNKVTGPVAAKHQDFILCQRPNKTVEAAGQSLQPESAWDQPETAGAEEVPASITVVEDEPEATLSVEGNVSTGQGSAQAVPAEIAVVEDEPEATVPVEDKVAAENSTQVSQGEIAAVAPVVLPPEGKSVSDVQAATESGSKSATLGEGAEEEATTGGNPDCWIDGYTYDSCCAPELGQGGDAHCWDGVFTYSRCCFPKVGSSRTAELEQVLPAQPLQEPTSAPLVLSSYEVGDLIEVANAVSQNPVTAWLPGVVTAKTEHPAAYTVRLTQGGRRGEPLRGVPTQLLRKVDPQRHAAASVRLSKIQAQATQAAQEVAHELAELEAAASAVRSATESVQAAKLAQVRPSALAAATEPEAASAPAPALPARVLAAGDHAEVRLQGPLAEGRPGPWLPCSVAAADDAPTAYDLHFVAVPQALRELRDVPGYMLHRVDAKVYSQALRRLREDPRTAQQAVGRLAEALGQGTGATPHGVADGAEADFGAPRGGDEQAKIRAAWDARHRGEVAKRAAAREAKRRAEELAKTEAIRQAKEEARREVEEEVKRKVEEELKRKAEEESRQKAARKAAAEFKRKMRGVEANAPAASLKDTPPGASAVAARQASNSIHTDNDGVRVRVRDAQGHMVQLKVGRHTHLRALINAASDKLLLPREKTTLSFAGAPLQPLDTADSVGIHDLDLIEARSA